MINIQRNFFIENILFEANLLTKNKNNDIPYNDYLKTSIKNDLIIIFLDIDRIENKNIIIKDLVKFKNKKNNIIFIPISKNLKKLNEFINNIEKKKIIKHYNLKY